MADACIALHRLHCLVSMSTHGEGSFPGGFSHNFSEVRS